MSSPDSDRLELLPVEKKLSPQRLDEGVLHGSPQRDKVAFFHLVRRMGQAVEQLAIVGQQQQALGIAVKPAHRHSTGAQAGQQVGHAPAPLLIFHGCDIAARLVQHDIGMRRPFLPNHPSVHRNAVAVVHLAANLRHDAVDRHTALLNELLGGAARAQPAVGQIFL